MLAARPKCFVRSPAAFTCLVQLDLRRATGCFCVYTTCSTVLAEDREDPFRLISSSENETGVGLELLDREF